MVAMKIRGKAQRLVHWTIWLTVQVACLGQFFPGAGLGTSSSRSAGFQLQPREYRSYTTLGEAYIEVDEDTRSLIIVTDEATRQQIEQIIKSLDRPRPQVLLDALFLEVTLTDDLDVGVEGLWRYRSNGVEGTLGTDFNTTSILQGGFHEAIADDWQVTLRMLAQKGALKVLSRPTILAMNNQEAVIMVGQEVPFVTNTRVTEAGQTINTIQYSEVGIILRVTPFITSEGWVQMIVRPEISTLTAERVQISETVSSPVIATRSAETVVVTPNGKTVVIGGLIDNNKTESVQKVPLLGDIPLLGHVFRRTVKRDSRTELLIFLTPHVIRTPDDLVEVTRWRAGRATLAPRAVPDNNLQQFLESLQPPEEILLKPQNAKDLP